MTLHFVYVAKGQEHVDMAIKSAHTVLEHHPDANFTMLVDDDYSMSEAVNVLTICEPQIFLAPWMVANVRAQVHYLLRHGANFNTTVFLDNDIVMRRPLPELNAAMDMHVTWRDNVGAISDAQPYNYGVLIVRHTVDAIRAMMWLENRVSQMHPRHQKWYGNQMALRELVGPLEKKIVTRPFGSFEIMVDQLPCHKWNWSPPEDKLRQNAKDKVFVHLKGDRKEAFDYYYDMVMREMEDGESKDEDTGCG